MMQTPVQALPHCLHALAMTMYGPPTPRLPHPWDSYAAMLESAAVTITNLL